ncbi:hypothetical protein [Granulicoccus phenolivorans]|uniref:hypothetical protein n=1 Tax=Granulicoccus phenolivorans TaxID=266854 RepID=UPI000423BAF8|nr:hypothetical protein [Granulicoccus phenolivorans]
MDTRLRSAIVPVTLVGLVAAGMVAYNATPAGATATQSCVNRETMERVDDYRCETSSGAGSGAAVYGWYYTNGGRYVGVGQRVPAGGRYTRPTTGAVNKAGVGRSGGTVSRTGSDSQTTTNRTGSSGSDTNTGSKSKTKKTETKKSDTKKSETKRGGFGSKGNSKGSSGTSVGKGSGS